MANIPIFDAPPGGGAPLTVRPTRIITRLDEVASRGFEGAARAGNALAEVGSQMVRANNQNAWQSGIVTYGSRLNNLHANLPAVTGSTSFPDYMEQVKKLSDPTDILNNSKLSGVPLAHLRNNLLIRQREFMDEVQNNTLVKMHKGIQGDADTNLDGYAQLAAHSGPDHYPLYKQMGLDAIDHDEATGIFNSEESEKRRQAFANKLDFYGVSGYVKQDPAAALHLLMSPDIYKQYPNLSESQIWTLAGHANQLISKSDRTASQWMKSQRNQIENEFIQRMSNGTLDPAWADKMANRKLISPDLYRMAYGRPAPSEGNYEAFTHYSDMINDPNMTNADQLDEVRKAIVGDTNINTQERQMLMVEYSRRRSYLHTPMDIATSAARSTYASRLAQWEHDIDPYGVNKYLPGYSGRLSTNIKAAKAAFEAQLKAATSPDKVQDIVNNFDFSKYAPTAPATVNPVPPLPKDPTLIKRLGSIKVGS